MLRKPKSKIFVNYRRGDSSGHTGRLCADLTRRLGTRRVFMDIDTIPPGVDFVEVIEQAVQACDVFIAVIGKEWLTISAGGARRLDDPNDWVRLEIAAALERGIPVIPVLVNGAVMPRADDLPDNLQRLARRQAIEISDKRWDYDVTQLVRAIGTLLNLKPVAKPERSARYRQFADSLRVRAKSPAVKKSVIGSASLVVLVAAVSGLWSRLAVQTELGPAPSLHVNVTPEPTAVGSPGPARLSQPVSEASVNEVPSPTVAAKPLPTAMPPPQTRPVGKQEQLKGRQEGANTRAGTVNRSPARTTPKLNNNADMFEVVEEEEPEPEPAPTPRRRPTPSVTIGPP